MVRGIREYKGDSKCGCGKDIPVYLTGGGMLTTSCGWCRLQMHMPQGSQSYRAMMGRLTGGSDPQKQEPPPPPPKPAPKVTAPPPPPKPDKPAEPASEKTIFDIFKG